MAEEKEKLYICHYCLNENLPVDDKDYCGNCWVDVAHGTNSCAPQNWKYCSDCVKKGYPEIKAYTKGRKIRQEMITKKTGYVFTERVYTEEQRRAIAERLQKSRKSKVDSSI